jgi:hypothetical protein
MIFEFHRLLYHEAVPSATECPQGADQRFKGIQASCSVFPSLCAPPSKTDFNV